MYTIKTDPSPTVTVILKEISFNCGNTEQICITGRKFNLHCRRK